MKPTYRHLILALIPLALAGVAQAQLVQVFHDVFYEDDGTILTYPEGGITYRIWAQMENTDDALVAVYAADDNFLHIGATDLGIWNSEFGAVVGSSLNEVFFASFPVVEYDSFVTIGRASNADEGTDVTALSLLPSETAFFDSFASETEATFNPDLDVQDGVWFSVANNPNVFGQGPDQLILLGQVTTVGDLSYRLNVQILIGGAGGEVIKFVWDPEAADAIDDEYDGSMLGLEYPSSVCTINDASLDYSCEWSPELQQVVQQFVLSSDATVGCFPDSLEVVTIDPPGDPVYFNLEDYSNELVTEGSVDVSDLLGSLDQDLDYGFKIWYTNVLSSVNVTDAFSFQAACGIVAGCTLISACNYNPLATVNDGSCSFQSNTSIEHSLSLHIYPLDNGVPYNGSFECDEIGGAWFCLVPPNDSVTVAVSGADFNVRMRIYDSAENLLTLVDNETGGSESLEDLEVEPGEVYYIQVQGEGLPADPEDFDFDILLTDASGTLLEGDLDGNGILTSADLLEFLPLIGGSNAIADFDDSGLVSTWDFLVLLTRLRAATTCP